MASHDHPQHPTPTGDTATPPHLSEPTPINAALHAEPTEIVSDDPTLYQGDVRVYEVVGTKDGENIVEEVPFNNAATAHREI